MKLSKVTLNTLALMVSSSMFVHGNKFGAKELVQEHTLEGGRKLLRGSTIPRVLDELKCKDRKREFSYSNGKANCSSLQDLVDDVLKPICKENINTHKQIKDICEVTCGKVGVGKCHHLTSAPTPVPSLEPTPEPSLSPAPSSSPSSSPTWVRLQLPLVGDIDLMSRDMQLLFQTFLYWIAYEGVGFRGEFQPMDVQVVTDDEGNSFPELYFEMSLDNENITESLENNFKTLGIGIEVKERQPIKPSATPSLHFLFSLLDEVEVGDKTLLEHVSFYASFLPFLQHFVEDFEPSWPVGDIESLLCENPGCISNASFWGQLQQFLGDFGIPSDVESKIRDEESLFCGSPGCVNACDKLTVECLTQIIPSREPEEYSEWLVDVFSSLGMQDLIVENFEPIQDILDVVGEHFPGLFESFESKMCGSKGCLVDIVKDEICGVMNVNCLMRKLFTPTKTPQDYFQWILNHVPRLIGLWNSLQEVLPRVEIQVCGNEGCLVQKMEEQFCDKPRCLEYFLADLGNLFCQGPDCLMNDVDSAICEDAGTKGVLEHVMTFLFSKEEHNLRGFVDTISKFTGSSSFGINPGINQALANIFWLREHVSAHESEWCGAPSCLLGPIEEQMCTTEGCLDNIEDQIYDKPFEMLGLYYPVRMIQNHLTERLSIPLNKMAVEYAVVVASVLDFLSQNILREGAARATRAGKQVLEQSDIIEELEFLGANYNSLEVPAPHCYVGIIEHMFQEQTRPLSFYGGGGIDHISDEGIAILNNYINEVAEGIAIVMDSDDIDNVADPDYIFNEHVEQLLLAVDLQGVEKAVFNNLNEIKNQTMRDEST